MKTFIQPLLTLVVILLAFSGCSAWLLTPPDHYGAYLLENGDTVELEEILGWYDPDDLPGMPVISHARPTIILIAPQFNYQLIFYNHSTQTRVGFSHEPAGENIIEITPVDDLDPGVYCLTLGNITLTAMEMPSWCFIVNSGD